MANSGQWTSIKSTPSPSRDSGFLDMETLSLGESMASSPFSSATATPDGSVFDELEEVDIISASVKVVNQWSHQSTETNTIQVTGDSRERQSTSAPVGPVNIFTQCGTGGSISVNTYLAEVGPEPIPSMQVFLIMTGGVTKTCNLNIEATVGQLMEKVYEITNVPIDQQRLTFQGKTLSCKTELLTSYGIENLSTVHMMGRLRGGADDNYNNNNNDNNGMITRFGKSIFNNATIIINAANGILLILVLAGLTLMEYVA